MYDPATGFTGPNLNSDEEMIADALRRQQGEGQFLSLSTLAPVAQLGNQQQRQAVAGLENVGRLRQARIARDQRLEDIDSQRGYEDRVRAEEEEAKVSRMVQRYALMGDRDRAKALDALELTDAKTAGRIKQILTQSDAKTRLQELKGTQSKDLAKLKADLGAEQRDVEQAFILNRDQQKFANQMALQNDRQDFTGRRDEQKFAYQSERDATQQGYKQANARLASQLNIDEATLNAELEKIRDQMLQTFKQENITLEQANRMALAEFKASKAEDIAKLERQHETTEAELNRNLRRELKKLDGAAGGAFIPSKKAQEAIVSSVVTLSRIARLDNMASAFTERENSQLNQIAKDITIEMFAPDATKQALRNIALTAGNPKLQNFLTAGYMLESMISKEQSGLALTKYEIAQRQNWSPLAPGLTVEERLRRLNEIRRDLKDGLGVYANVYGSAYVDAATAMEQSILDSAGADMTAPQNQMRLIPRGSDVPLDEMSDDQIRALIRAKKSEGLR